MRKELIESLGDTIESYEMVYPEVEWRKCCGDYNFVCDGCWWTKMIKNKKERNDFMCKLGGLNQARKTFFDYRNYILDVIKEFEEK